MKTRTLLLWAVGVVAALAATKAGAQTLVAEFVEIKPGLSIDGTVNGGSFYPAGLMKFTDFDAFCVDPAQSLSYGETVVYQVQDPATLANSATVARLIGGFLASDQSAAHATAVQWAIWEIIAETTNPPSLHDGNVIITGPAGLEIADLANDYLLNVNSFTPVSLIYLTSDTRQDVVTWQVIPEPATAGLAALSALVLFRRRR